MRWALARVATATTLMVALAFCIPLAIVTHQVAEDRAMTQARESAGSIVTVLAATDDAVGVRRAIAADKVGSDGRIAVHMPGSDVVGTSHVGKKVIDNVSESVNTRVEDLANGVAYLRVALLPSDKIAVVEVYVPQELLTKGVSTAWLTLAGIAILLVTISVLMADRLGATVVRSSRSLARASSELGAGDLSVRVRTKGPAELTEAGDAFNIMADRIVSMVDAERELAADLSHRLRTPLTALRLDTEALWEGPDTNRIRASVDALEREVDAVILGARRSITERSVQCCDVSQVVGERMRMWGELAEDFGREYEVVGLDVPLWVNIPRDDLLSSVDALIGNVFAHTPQDAPFRVEVDAREGALIVSDGGGGVANPAEALRRGSSSAGSSGLGLDIVSRVAQSARGTVHIGRSEWEGARIVWDFGAACTSEPPSGRAP